MSARRGPWTALVAIALGALGFAAGAGGSAWQTRQLRAEPWRKLVVEHQGARGTTTRTRVVFQNPKLALQAIEVIRSPEGEPELSHVSLRDGEELTLRYEDGARPSSLEGPDGGQATLAYEGGKVEVTFFGPGGEEVSAERVSVPVELRGALRLARAEAARSIAVGAVGAVGAAWSELEWIGEAHAQAAKKGGEDDAQVSVQREVVVLLEVRPVGAKVEPGAARVEVTCPPLACVPAAPTVDVPGEASVRILVSGNAPKSELGDAPGRGDLSAFERVAEDERKVAEEVMPDVAAVIGALGVTALACKAQKIGWSICVKDLGKTANAAAGAVHGVAEHELAADEGAVSARAEALYFEEQARAALDQEVKIDVCLARDGYARACVDVAGSPLGEEPMAEVAKRLELRRGVGGAIAGSFVLTQSDGGDCKFSPSPRTGGSLTLSFDDEKGTITASFGANERGTRPNLACSLGTANMSWSQSYNVSATQSVPREALTSGGRLALRLTGTMNGSGSYSFSNCRTGGGASASCPAGKTEGYSYPVEITGDVDLDARTGRGRILVRNAPLSTSGTWAVPGEAAPR